MDRYQNILIINPDEKELINTMHTVNMFGLGEHVQTETNGISAWYYMQYAHCRPDLILVTLEKGEKTVVDFVEAFESLDFGKRMQSVIKIYYREDCIEFEKLSSFRFAKKLPARGPELSDPKSVFDNVA